MRNLDFHTQLKLQYEGFLEIPSIWLTSNPLGVPSFHLSKIKAKDPLSFDNIKENTLLGKRAEVFFAHQIQQNPKYEMLVERLQIFEDKITLGELDFIVKDLEEHRLIHVELVCKIYLLDDQFEDNWIGPNRKDGLAQKIDKLVNKQFPLLNFPFTQSTLTMMGLDTQLIVQQICFKTLLFVHLKQFKKDLVLQVNPECIVGFWIHSNEFIEEEFAQDEFFIPKKQHWFVNPEVNSTWFSWEEIKQKIIEHHQVKSSPMVWMKTQLNNYLRFFVVWW